MKVEVAYASIHRQQLIALELPDNTTVEEAIRASGILKQFPEIILETAKIGIFSKWCSLQQMLREGDRVEIYRPLIADPKQIRRQRARRE